MNKSGDMNEFLETCCKILIRCFVIEMVFLLFWFFVFLIGGDFAFGIHSKMFDIDKHEFDLMTYYGMAFIKISAFLIFLFPYISIKLVLRRKGVNP